MIAVPSARWRLPAATGLALLVLVWLPLHAQDGAQALARLWEQPAPRGGLPQAIAIDARDPQYLYVADKTGGVEVLKLGPASRTTRSDGWTR